jgi:hypothetical protein
MHNLQSVRKLFAKEVLPMLFKTVNMHQHKLQSDFIRLIKFLQNTVCLMCFYVHLKFIEVPSKTKY